MVCKKAWGKMVWGMLGKMVWDKLDKRTRGKMVCKLVCIRGTELLPCRRHRRRNRTHQPCKSQSADGHRATGRSNFQSWRTRRWSLDDRNRCRCSHP